MLNPHNSQEFHAGLNRQGYREIKEGEYREQENELDEIFLHLNEDERPFVRIKVLDIPIVGLLDSGARKSVLGGDSEGLIKSCKLKIFPSNVELSTASGQKLEVRGYVNLPMTFNGTTKIISTFVVPKLKRTLILGTDFWKAFGITPSIPSVDINEVQATAVIQCLTPDQQQELQHVKSLFKKAEEGRLDSTPLIMHRIELTEEARKLGPVRINPYPNSPKRQEQINRELDRMLEAGIIEKSYSDWALRLVPVDKQDDTVRLCLDARKLNERTMRDCYPLPHADRILSRLGPCKFISTIDLSKAFLQIPLHPKSKKFTAFSVVGKGLFQFTRMPFGLVNSPATLSRLMDRVLGAGKLEPKVFVYLDDIVVATQTFEEHMVLLREVRSRLKTANLSINLSKSQFCVGEVPYLGYVLSRNGLRPNPDRVEAIVNFERPKTLKALRRFLGMSNYYRRFISEYSQVVQPLTDLLKNKPASIRWDKNAESAFSRIKERLITAPILTSPDFEKPFSIHCDASNTAIAGVLTQMHEKIERPIAYFSQKLSEAQQRYSATEKEALAVLNSIQKFRCYVEGSQFTVITDASALMYILRSSWRTSSRLCRWSMELQRYDMIIKHRRGVDNVVPDALSRSIEVVSVQTTDDWYTKIKKQVLANPEKYKDFRIDNGVLKKFIPVKTDSLDYRFEWKTCVPQNRQEHILVEEHDDALHLGAEKTISRIRKKYFWPRITEDVRKYIRQCSICQLSKPSTRSQHPEMGKQRITTKPFQILALDFIQSLPRSKMGNSHILVMMDLFSKFCLLFPLRRISTGQVGLILQQNWFRRYSTPECIITDNASTFLSHDFKRLLDKYHIQHWANTRHHSQANPVERLNRTINACIRTYVRTDQKLWDSRISEIEYVLNTTPHTATGFSPYRILFGHEIVGRGDEHRMDRDEDKVSDEERIGKKIEIDRFIFDLVYKQLKKQYEKNKKFYDLRYQHKAPSYEVGQRVLKRNFRLSSASQSYNSKLGPCYVPCVIIARIGTSSYELADDTGKNIGIFSAADLKPIEGQ